MPGAWGGSPANPKRSYTLLNKESPEFIRFVNPSDYRVAREACGSCHLEVIEAAERSLMSTGAMLWGGAAYNNGIVPYKNYIFGEAYTRDGKPAYKVTRLPAAGDPVVDRVEPHQIRYLYDLRSAGCVWVGEFANE